MVIREIKAGIPRTKRKSSKTTLQTSDRETNDHGTCLPNPENHHDFGSDEILKFYL